MKKKSKSSSSSKRKDRSRSPSVEGSSKRAKSHSKSREKVKDDDKTAPRKTRWEAVNTKDSPKKASKSTADSSGNVPISESESKQEKSGQPLRIKDLLHDKEKIVELLFQTVTGAALQELIPDYLKKRPDQELKKLCLEELQKISEDEILQIISGKGGLSNKAEEKKVEEEKKEKEQNLETEKQPDAVEEKKMPTIEETSSSEKKLAEVSKIDAVDSCSNDVLELNPTATEMEGILDEENQIPPDIKEEVAKDLILPERDAELLELEMRARAIRSLLKAKSQGALEGDTLPKDDKEK